MTYPSSASVQHWVRLVCEDLAFLRDRAAAAGAATSDGLATLVATAAQGRADAAWVEQLVELLRRLGVPAAPADRGWPFPDASVGGLPGAEGGAPAMDVFRCPRRLCSRVELRRPGGAVPHCAVAAVDLFVAGE